LEDVIMSRGDILINGTFNGITERPAEIDPAKTATGTYGGVIGGPDGSSIAGGIFLERVFDRANDQIDGALERGIFVLDQCGLTTSGGDCVGTAP
jgi:hypothetical protein